MTYDELKNEMAKELARFNVEFVRARHASRLCYLATALKDKMEKLADEANHITDDTKLITLIPDNSADVVKACTGVDKWPKHISESRGFEAGACNCIQCREERTKRTA